MPVAASSAQAKNKLQPDARAYTQLHCVQTLEILSWILFLRDLHALYCAEAHGLDQYFLFVCI
jgi:hypothetical protein